MDCLLFAVMYIIIEKHPRKSIIQFIFSHYYYWGNTEWTFMVHSYENPVQTFLLLLEIKQQQGSVS